MNGQQIKPKFFTNIVINQADNEGFIINVNSMGAAKIFTAQDFAAAKKLASDAIAAMELPVQK
jgi:hypothetical protein